MVNDTSIKGSVLRASNVLAGSYFEDAIILVAVDDENGSFGLMLNRPSHMPLNEVFNPVPDVVDIKRPFYIGGPVDEEGLHLLHLCSEINNRNGLEISSGLELGGEWENIDEILLSDPEKTFLFLGYSGWDAGQLEDELKEGSWDVYQPNLLNLVTHLPNIAELSSEEFLKLLEK